MNLKTEAEIVCKCLEFDLISVSDVISWADNLIEESEQPDIAVIEVSMSNNCHINDVRKLLKDITGTVEPNLVYQGIFDKMISKLQNEPESVTRIVGALIQMAMSGEVPDKSAESKMFWFNDALYDGNIEEVRRKLHAFLNQYAYSSTQNRKG